MVDGVELLAGRWESRGDGGVGVDGSGIGVGGVASGCAGLVGAGAEEGWGGGRG